MLTGEKILVTGPAGNIAEPICEQLAPSNEVWGIARFSEAGSQDRLESKGVRTHACDLSTGSFAGIPEDFTVVLHLAALMSGTDYDRAISVNAEGTGLLLQHCRRAKAALVMSTGSVYKPHEDPWHAYLETDPLGEDALPANPTYSVSKIAEEGVARAASRMFDLPVVIARMNAAYGNKSGLQAMHLQRILAGQPVVVRWDPCPYSPISSEDICAQLEAMVGAASIPANIVNWGGDEGVTPQEWVPFLADLAGVKAELVVEEIPGAKRGVLVDVTKRRAITGPCAVAWQDGMRQMFEALHSEHG